MLVFLIKYKVINIYISLNIISTYIPSLYAKRGLKGGLSKAKWALLQFAEASCH